MKLVIGVIAAAWVIGFVGGAISWSTSASAGDSMLVGASIVLALANIALYVGVITLVIAARRKRGFDEPREDTRAMFRRHAPFAVASGVLLVIGLLALIGVFGTSHAINSLIIGGTMHVIGIWNVVIQAELIQRKHLVHV
jgi:hypothetical protein